MAESTINGMPLVGTAIGSSAIGDQFGNGLADIVSWLITIWCGCIPPAPVLSAVHTVMVTVIVAGACYAHIKLFKQPQT